MCNSELKRKVWNVSTTSFGSLFSHSDRLCKAPLWSQLVDLKRVLCWKRLRYQAHYTSFNTVSGSSAEACEAFFPITAKVSGMYHLVAGQQQTLSQCYYNILPCLWNIKSIEFLRLKDIVIFENINFVAATLLTSLCLTNEFVGTGWMCSLQSSPDAQAGIIKVLSSLDS